MSTGTNTNKCSISRDLFIYCCLFTKITILFAIIMVTFLVPSHNPDELKFTVSNAILTRFEFSALDLNNTLSYSLSLNLTVINPNNKGGVYFEQFQVIAKYLDRTFGVTTLGATPFQLGPHDTNALKAVLDGNQAVYFEKEKDIETYQLEKEGRAFSIDLKIALRLRNVTFRKTKNYLVPPKIDCYGLKIPFSDNSTMNNSSRNMVFKAKSCVNVFILTSPPTRTTGFGTFGR